MNPLYAIGFMLIGILLVILVASLIVWRINASKRLPPRYIKETQRWLWLINKKPLRVWKEFSKKHHFTWLDWDQGVALYHTKTTGLPLPDKGDLIVVDGRYNKQYVFVVTDTEDTKIDSCYLGYLYERK